MSGMPSRSSLTTVRTFRVDVTPEKVAALYGEGLSIDEVAERLHANPFTIRRRLAEAGVQTRTSGDTLAAKAATRLDPLLLAVLHHGACMSITAVAREVGGSPKTVRAALQESGQEVRTSNRKPLDVAAMTAMYVDQGMELKEIGAKVGADPATVWKRLKEAGVPMRKAWRQKSRNG
jgi:DNA-directed RNA polymerase specialized sigma24 family protein